MLEPNALLNAALQYAKAGWSVLPCRPRTKIPLTKHGLKDATNDIDQIKRWWQSEPNANIAIRCGIASSGLVVVDVDGPEGEESLKGKSLPPTAIAKTGGGGWHYFYRSTARIRPKVGVLPKVDIRAEDSYVVVPPSIHPSGATYDWQVMPRDAGLHDLPEWVIEAMVVPELPQSNGQAPKPGEIDKRKVGRAALQFVADGAPKGQQRLVAVAAARNLLSAGYSVDATAHKLWQGFQACEQDAEQPWTMADARKIAQDIADKPAPPMREMAYQYNNPANGRTPMIITTSAIDLMRKEFPPVKFLIPRIWPEGMSLLAAKPKIGKTWLSLGIATAIAFGGVALGTAKVEEGEVLYLALEDGERRIQGRLRAMLLDQEPPPNLHFAYSWPRVSEGGVEALAEWMQTHPRTRLIVVDTLRKLRPVERVGASSYNQDYDAISPLTELSHEYNVSIWGVSHLRKMVADDPLEQVSGTMGLTGAADHIFVLKRERTQAQAILYVMSRDIPEEELALEWQPPHWVLVGTAKEAKQSAERKEIIEVMQKLGHPSSPKEIADTLGRNAATIRGLLSRMNMDGIVVSDGRGKYEVFPRQYGDIGQHPQQHQLPQQGQQGQQVNSVEVLTCLGVDPVDLYGQKKEQKASVQVGQQGQRGQLPQQGQHGQQQKVVDAEAVCFCGLPVYEYGTDGSPYCEQHVPIPPEEMQL